MENKHNNTIKKFNTYWKIPLHLVAVTPLRSVYTPSTNPK